MIPMRNYFKINYDARIPKPCPPIQEPSKKIHKSRSIFNYNTKFFHQLLTKKVEGLSQGAMQREDINEIARKLTKIFEKIRDSKIYFPDYIMSYIYSIFKNPKGFSCNSIDDFLLNQKATGLPMSFTYNEPQKDIEKQWLDIKITKNLENNKRDVNMTGQKSFANLSKLIKIEPKKLEMVFYQCSANISIFNEYLRTRDKKLLWYEIEDKILKEGKEKNPLAYDLLLFYKGSERRISEREVFLKKAKQL